MRVQGTAAGVILAAILLCGCYGPRATIKQPIAYQSIDGELGKVTFILANGEKTVKALPWDATWRVKDGQFTSSVSAFRLQALIGVSAYPGPSGLEGSPWAGIRFVHIAQVGLDFGFDKRNFTAGGDWLYHGLAIGPNIIWPYLASKSGGIGAKAAYLF